MFFLDHIWLIPLLPAFGAAIMFFFGRKLSKQAVDAVCVGVVVLAFLFGCGAVSQYTRWSHDYPGRPFEKILYTWLGSDTGHLNFLKHDGTPAQFQADAGFLLDPLSSIWLLFVTGVGMLIHIYSTGYMAHEGGYYRFFGYLNLFMFSMLTLVLANNYALLFVGWEGVGLCSYLLIGFYFHRKSASDAANKAFIVNRIGDAGFLLGMFTIAWYFGSLNFTTVTQIARDNYASLMGNGIITTATLLLFVGACGKSAQLPLYVWLPDAMEGPTPVSALIHAATMVTAGVYMIVRNHAIFDLSPTAMTIVGVIGGLTALFAATIGLVQTDIKRVLAYSTVSQLGYMFLGCGIGAYTAAMFHLMTHAFFKALLFLTAGSVIHALSGEQDIRKMGGLSSKIPWTYRLFLIGTVAIAGIPPLAGFWSKDEILAHASTHHHYLLYGMAAIGALLTSFYMFRLIYLTFYGTSRMDHHTEEHVHESPMVMVGPLMALGVLSILGGFLGFPPEHGWIHQFLAPVAGTGGEHDVSTGLVLMLMMIATGIALLGWGLAHYFYSVNLSAPDRLATKFQAAYRILLNKYYVDELYDLLWVEPTKKVGLLFDWFDRTVIDGLVRAVAHLAELVAAGSTWTEKHVIYGGINVVGYGNHLAARQRRQLQSGIGTHHAALIHA